ncbi:hypothetical protein LG003_11630 [Photorhabdus kleinii]|uniref:hypothetical protein n=1 Tax=Photorhabdus TaxID=29487 RepID=UPI0021D4E684|nr:hypothetical protein [Photorhabdus kleinii]MCT8343477.1 hypothetical protein [Photorhabdus kleinii]
MTNIALLHSHGTTKQKHSDIFKDIELMKKLKVESRKPVELENSPTEPANYFGLPRIAFSKDSKLPEFWIRN